ncbi:MAG: 50S ribosomal protein L17 [Candidatus Nomurabacteria bacterium]|jgi:large subunit ribosomal protein L17|nr:50S ribosomal protein L17 [Candidatus Nomurabacteria bacterium]
MHRHGYKGRKFGRERDQRRALLRGLMRSLVEHQSIVTTLPKAKELRPKMEKIISKARKGDLANRRRVIAALDNVVLGQFLVDKIAPQIKRGSGYLRVIKLEQARVGDNAPMARIEFVDDIVLADQPVTKAETTEAVKNSTTGEKPVSKTETTDKEEKK